MKPHKHAALRPGENETVTHTVRVSHTRLVFFLRSLFAVKPRKRADLRPAENETVTNETVTYTAGYIHRWLKYTAGSARPPLGGGGTVRLPTHLRLALALSLVIRRQNPYIAVACGECSSVIVVIEVV